MRRLLLAALVIYSSGCSALGEKPKLITVTGQVFIVTAGRENLKLALVTVGAHPESTVARAIAQVQAEAAAAQSGIDSMNVAVAAAGQLANDVGTTEARYAELRARLSGNPDAVAFIALIEDGHTLEQAVARAEELIEKRCDQLRERVLLGESYDDALTHVRLLSALIEAMEEADPATRTLLALRQMRVSAKLARGTADALVSRYGRFGTSRAYFESLPPATQTTKTDADGRFSLQLPLGQRIALGAQATRMTPDGEEIYSWLVWITPRDGQENTIMLGNDNLMTSGSVESVVQVKS